MIFLSVFECNKIIELGKMKPPRVLKLNRCELRAFPAFVRGERESESTEEREKRREKLGKPKEEETKKKPKVKLSGSNFPHF